MSDDVYSKLALRNVVTHCAPVEGNETSIWSCEAKGEIVAFANREHLVDNGRTTVSHAKLWLHIFTLRNPASVAMEIYFHETFSKVRALHFTLQLHYSGNMIYSTQELLATVVRHTKIDLCAPDNKMLKSPEDAAQVIVERKTLWLSKEVLGGASPYFHAYFNNNFKEKREGVYPMTDVKLEEFMRFVTIIYGVHVDIDKTSLQYLLRLEDLYLCEAVRSKCLAFLVATDTLTLQEKLQIGDRFRVEDVIDIAIGKMNIDELTAIGQQMQFETYSPKTTFAIFKALLKLNSRCTTEAGHQYADTFMANTPKLILKLVPKLNEDSSIKLPPKYITFQNLIDESSLTGIYDITITFEQTPFIHRLAEGLLSYNAVVCDGTSNDSTLVCAVLSIYSDHEIDYKQHEAVKGYVNVYHDPESSLIKLRCRSEDLQPMGVILNDTIFAKNKDFLRF